MNWCPRQDVVPPHTKCSWKRKLRIHCDPDQNKTQNQWALFELLTELLPLVLLKRKKKNLFKHSLHSLEIMPSLCFYLYLPSLLLVSVSLCLSLCLSDCELPVIKVTQRCWCFDNSWLVRPLPVLFSDDLDQVACKRSRLMDKIAVACSCARLWWESSSL